MNQLVRKNGALAPSLYGKDGATQNGWGLFRRMNPDEEVSKFEVIGGTITLSFFIFDIASADLHEFAKVLFVNSFIISSMLNASFPNPTPEPEVVFYRGI